MELGARLLRKSEISEVANLLAQAFFENPSYRAVFPSAAKRHRQLQYFFRQGLALHHKAGCTYVLPGEGRIVATYTLAPAGAVSTRPLSLLFSGGWKAPFVLGIAPLRGLLAARRYFDGLLAAHASRQHIYLGWVATHPDFRRQGLGNQLLKHIQETISGLALQGVQGHSNQPNPVPENAGENPPVVLFTQHAWQVDFYEKIGFQSVIKSYPPSHFNLPDFPSWVMVKRDASVTE